MSSRTRQIIEAQTDIVFQIALNLKHVAFQNRGHIKQKPDNATPNYNRIQIIKNKKEAKNLRIDTCYYCTYNRLPLRKNSTLRLDDETGCSVRFRVSLILVLMSIITTQGRRRRVQRGLVPPPTFKSGARKWVCAPPPSWTDQVYLFRFILILMAKFSCLASLANFTLLIFQGIVNLKLYNVFLYIFPLLPNNINTCRYQCIHWLPSFQIFSL